MDGVVHSRTLSAVLIASASAAGSAIYKVIFKKLMGCVTFSQVSVMSQVTCEELELYLLSLISQLLLLHSS